MILKLKMFIKMPFLLQVLVSLSVLILFDSYLRQPTIIFKSSIGRKIRIRVIQLNIFSLYHIFFLIIMRNLDLLLRIVILRLLLKQRNQ